MLKIVIGLVLLGHCIGHTMGLMGLLNVAKPNSDWNGGSWLLTGTAGPTVTEIVGAVLWIAAIVGFTAVAGVVVGWLPVAVLVAVLWYHWVPSDIAG